MEVYVQPFPSLGAKRIVSRGGGAEPRWRADGRELYYISSDGQMMAVPVMLTPALEFGPPEVLFSANVNDLVWPFVRRYDVAPDGQRFILSERLSDSPPVTVVLNWPSLLNR
jgi:hypothetical protein